MFRHPSELTPTERLDLVIADAIAIDTDTKKRLHRSYGRRKAGRKPKYFFDGHHITADSDDEAIDKANAILAKTEVRA